MSSLRKSKPSVGPYCSDSARSSAEMSALMRSKTSRGKVSVAGSPPASEMISGRAVRLMRSRIAEERITRVRDA